MGSRLRTTLSALIIAAFSIHGISLADTRPAEEDHRIQLAILLDTSNSMDGLIDQTRSQLWSMVDELSNARKNGRAAKLEVAILEYGNQGLSKNSGYIRTVTNLTSDLDRVSEALFSLKTNGGDEYCGYVIQTAVNNLQWSRSPQDLKLIYIAGNEPFTQGPVNYKSAIRSASSQHITVSTIFAGELQQGIATGWHSGALLAGGNFMNIDQNQAVVHIDAPQDKRILELNAKLNDTYVPYGTIGKASKKRQETQDQANTNVSSAMMAQRAKSKASKVYKNANWDLVDAMENETFDLDSVPEAQLPAPMAKMNGKEKREWLQAKKRERDAIKEEIKKLSEERDTHVAEEKRKMAESEADTVDKVLTSSIKRQAGKLDYKFE